MATMQNTSFTGMGRRSNRFIVLSLAPPKKLASELRLILYATRAQHGSCRTATSRHGKRLDTSG